MARRRRGAPITGWLIIDKPRGMGSTEVVTRVRRALNAHKAGHAGTLDPDATGVLAVALGEATKCVPVLMEALKCYRFTVTFGSETTTDDAAGEILRTSDARPDDDAITAALPRFQGEIMQRPPRVSAIRIDGARAYDLARKGEDPAPAPRPIWIESIEFIARPDADRAEFRMVCGKGGYVRSFARDIGEALGCLGHVETLCREWSGPFHLDDAIPLAQFEEAAEQGAAQSLLLPLEMALDGLPELAATIEGAARIRNGNPGQVTGHVDYGAPVWVSADGHAIALGHYMGGEVHPHRVFNR